MSVKNRNYRYHPYINDDTVDNGTTDQPKSTSCTNTYMNKEGRGKTL